jgi:hypothetical protein
MGGEVLTETASQNLKDLLDRAIALGIDIPFLRAACASAKMDFIESLKAECGNQESMKRSNALIASGKERARQNIDRGIGKHLADDVQDVIFGLEHRAAGRKVGLSRHAIRRLRKRAPFDMVAIGFPRP